MNIELLEGGKLPSYAHLDDACMDFYSRAEVSWEYENGIQTAVVPLGVKIEVPRGYALLLFSRSGMGFKKNITLANSVGVIDSGFTGELQAKLIKHTISLDCEQSIQKGDKVVQGMLVRRPKIYLKQVDSIKPITERADGGFGSTGK